MVELQIVKICLHRDNTTIAEVCALFDSVIEYFSLTSSILTPSASIVDCLNFESDWVKIQTNREFELTQVEKVAVK